MYFWRTHDQKEIDLIEESEGKFDVYEFKWNVKKPVRSFAHSSSNYPVRSASLISKEEIEEFVG
jgi:hypothetical protein